MHYLASFPSSFFSVATLLYYFKLRLSESPVFVLKLKTKTKNQNNNNKNTTNWEVKQQRFIFIFHSSDWDQNAGELISWWGLPGQETGAFMSCCTKMKRALVSPLLIRQFTKQMTQLTISTFNLPVTSTPNIDTYTFRASVYKVVKGEKPRL